MRISNYTEEQLVRLAADHRKLAAWPTTMTELFVKTQLAAAEAIEELLDRRAEAASSLRSLERSMAFERAAGIIGGCCLHPSIAFDDEYEWYDLSTVEPGPGAVSEEIEYLEARGLLEHHPDDPNWITIRYEDEVPA